MITQAHKIIKSVVPQIADKPYFNDKCKKFRKLKYTYPLTEEQRTEILSDLQKYFTGVYMKVKETKKHSPRFNRYTNFTSFYIPNQN